MAVGTVATWRPHAGRMQDFVAVTVQARKIHQRLGATTRIWQTQFGGEPMTLLYVIQVADWASFGQFAGKLEADGEWQQLVANFLANPSAELVQNAVLSTPPGLE